MPSQTSSQNELPLISRKLLLCLTLLVVSIAVFTVAISLGGRWFGQRMALGGHTLSQEIHTLTIGEDTLELAANTIRFAEQRRSGPAERVDLYLTWPGLQGYSQAQAHRFDDWEHPNQLIFLQISQSTMSRDMSGRIEPIYSQLFQGSPEPFDHGLTLHHLRSSSGYAAEVMLTADRPAGEPYAIRCILPPAQESTTSGDCQRDIHIGRDLSVLYRFSSQLLPDWDHIDAAVKLFVEERLQRSAGRRDGTG